MNKLRVCAAVPVALLVGALLVAAAPAAVAVPAAVTVPAALPPGGSFVAVTPTRLLDTRKTTGRTQSTSVQPLAGLPGVAGSTVAAVLLNVTVVDAAGPGYVVVGAGQGTSNGNYVKATASATLALVRLPATGSVPITSFAPANLVVDVQGYVTTPAAATSASYTALTAPKRVVDTRRGVGLTRFGPGQTQTLDVGDRAGLPADATGVVVNLTVATATTSTYVTGWSGVGPRPTVSSVNAAPGAVTANRALLPLDASGRLALFNLAGRTDLVVDVVGYTAPDATGSFYTPVTASRLLDARTQSAALAPTIDANASGVNVLAPGVADLAPTTSVWLTLVGDQPAGPGYITARPADVGPTGTSDVNLLPGRAVANAGPVRVAGDDGGVTVTSSVPSRVVADLSGWFRQAPPATTPAGLWSSTRYPDYTDTPARADTLPSGLPTSFGRGVYAGAGFRTQTTGYAIATDTTVVQSTHQLAQPGRVGAWSTPARVGTLTGVTALATAGETLTAATYALDALGRLYGFQSNSDGELGTTPNDFITYPLVPTRIPLPAGSVVAAVFAAPGIGYARLADGTVYSWGRDDTSQLGRTATSAPWTPAPVTFPDSSAAVTAIAGDGRVSFALDAEGALTWWGSALPASGSGAPTVQATPVAYPGACAAGASLHADANGVWELCQDGSVVQVSDQGVLIKATLAVSGVSALAPGIGFDGGVRALLADGRVAVVPTSGPAVATAFTGATAIAGSPGVQLTLVGG